MTKTMRYTTLAAAVLAVSACSTTIQVPEQYTIDVPGCQIEVVDMRADSRLVYGRLRMETTHPIPDAIRNALCESPDLASRQIEVTLDEVECLSTDTFTESFRPKIRPTVKTRLITRLGDTERVVLVNGYDHEGGSVVAKNCARALNDSISQIAPAVSDSHGLNRI